MADEIEVAVADPFPPNFGQLLIRPTFQHQSSTTTTAVELPPLNSSIFRRYHYYITEGHRKSPSRFYVTCIFFILYTIGYKKGGLKAWWIITAIYLFIHGFPGLVCLFYPYGGIRGSKWSHFKNFIGISLLPYFCRETQFIEHRRHRREEDEAQRREEEVLARVLEEARARTRARIETRARMRLEEEALSQMEREDRISQMEKGESSGLWSVSAKV